MKKDDIKKLVDRLAIVRQEDKKLKAEEEQIKIVLESLGKKFIEGNEYKVTLKDCERTSLDLERIKTEMGMLWFNERLLTTYFVKFDIEPKDSKS